MDDYVQVFQNYGTYSGNGVNPKQINAGAETQNVLFKYSWTIQLQGGLHCLPEEVISPVFPNKTYSGITWYLTLIPTAYPFADKTIEVKLSLSSCNAKNLNANYKLRMKSLRDSMNDNWIAAPNKTFKLNEPPNFDDFIQLYPNANGLQMPNNEIIIECEITVPVPQFYQVQHQNIPDNQRNSAFQFTENLLTMFENEEFSDVTFSVNGRELKAHKVILAAGSSVFKVMFEHEMIEKKHNRVEITDIDFEVLRELIRFIYTEEVSKLENIAKELLVAADKYDLEKLKDMCENVLCKSVSIENVAEMFIFSDTYNAVSLKATAKDYIVGHSKTVCGTSGWKSMIITHPHLIAEAFIALSDNQQPIKSKGLTKSMISNLGPNGGTHGSRKLSRHMQGRAEPTFLRGLNINLSTEQTNYLDTLRNVAIVGWGKRLA